MQCNEHPLQSVVNRNDNVQRSYKSVRVGDIIKSLEKPTSQDQPKTGARAPVVAPEPRRSSPRKINQNYYGKSSGWKLTDAYVASKTLGGLLDDLEEEGGDLLAVDLSASAPLELNLEQPKTLESAVAFKGLMNLACACEMSEELEQRQGRPNITNDVHRKNTIRLIQQELASWC